MILNLLKQRKQSPLWAEDGYQEKALKKGQNIYSYGLFKGDVPGDVENLAKRPGI